MATEARPLAVVLWLALIALAIWTLTAARITQDLSQFMPSGADDGQRLAVTLLREGPATRLILLAIEGGDAAQRAEASRALAAQLRQDARLQQVANGTGDLDPTALEPFFPYRYLLSPSSAKGWEADALRQALQQRLAELSSAFAFSDPRRLASDPTAAFSRWLAGLQPGHAPVLEHGVWSDPEHGRALLLARSAEASLDAAQQQALVAAMHRAFAASTPAPGLRLRMAGTPVYAAETRASIRGQLTALSTAAGVFVTLLLWLGYRSLRLALLAALPLASAGLIGAAAVVWLFGQIHGITLVFGITLVGVALDYPVHLFSHLSGHCTPARVMRRLWPTLRLGAATTAVGYLAFVRSDFTGLAQLGVYAAAGLLTAAAVTRWLLPGLIPPTQTLTVGPRLARLAGPLLGLRRGPAAMAITAAIVATAALWLGQPPQWETDLRALSPLSAEQRQLASELQQALGGAEAGHLIVVRGDDPAEALAHSEALIAPLQQARRQGLIEDFDLAARHLPSPATQRARQAQLPKPEPLARALSEAGAGLPFKTDAFAPFELAVAQSRELAPLSLAEALATPLGARLRPLLIEDGEAAYALVSLSGLSDPTAFAAWWRQQALSAASHLDLPAVSGAMLDGFRATTLERWGLGLAIIALLIALGRRSPRAALHALLPTLLAAALTLGLLGALGQRLSLFHLIALLLTVGIAIDYNLFFQRPAQAAAERLATLHALGLCALSTTGVFAILAASPTPVLAAIGLTVALGVPISLLLSLAAAQLFAPRPCPPPASP